MQLGITKRGRVLASIEAKSMFVEDINDKQFKDGNLGEHIIKIATGISQNTTLDSDGVLNHKGRNCSPLVDDLIKKLLSRSYG